jgi:hypothetical protein
MRVPCIGFVSDHCAVCQEIDSCCCAPEPSIEIDPAEVAEAASLHAAVIEEARSVISVSELVRTEHAHRQDDGVTTPLLLPPGAPLWSDIINEREEAEHVVAPRPPR